ncbi:MAG: sugar ABC transporter permease [Treponema sp.]|nr:sugar ABC transporter permease [Treponema sp.]
MKKSAASIREHIQPFLFLLPFLIGLIIFTVYPFINVIVLSFRENYRILSQTSTGLGLSNYRWIFTDRDFISGLRNTGLYVLFTVPISTALSVFFAVMLNRKLMFTGFFQTAFFMPMVTSVTAVGLVWRWLFNYDYGLFNYLLSFFGVSQINWLNDPAWALIALIIYGIWSMLPFTIILILAGLQSINPQYGIAAMVDGARPMLVFRRITLPLLAPTIGLVLILNVISTSKVFSELFPLFNGRPGPAFSLYTVVYYIYDMFYLKWRLAAAAAAAVILFLIVFVLTMVQLLIQRKWKHY